MVFHHAHGVAIFQSVALQGEGVGGAGSGGVFGQMVDGAVADPVVACGVDAYIWIFATERAGKTALGGEGDHRQLRRLAAPLCRWQDEKTNNCPLGYR